MKKILNEEFADLSEISALLANLVLN